MYEHFAPLSDSSFIHYILAVNCASVFHDGFPHHSHFSTRKTGNSVNFAGSGLCISCRTYLNCLCRDKNSYRVTSYVIGYKAVIHVMLSCASSHSLLPWLSKINKGLLFWLTPILYVVSSSVRVLAATLISIAVQLKPLNSCTIKKIHVPSTLSLSFVCPPFSFHSCDMCTFCPRVI
jgi:hypothetical protein